MHKLIPLLIFLSLSACGGGGSDAVESAVTDAATKQAAEAAAAAVLQDTANQAQQTALQKFGSGKFGQSTFQ